MRVFANITDQLTGLADRVAAGWLPSDGGHSLNARNQRVLRHILLGGVAGACLFPFALVPVLGPAVGFPVGAGGALALSLLAASIASYRLQRGGDAKAGLEKVEIQPFDGRFMPGLMTVHDAAGEVVGVSGRDKSDYLAKIDDPSGKRFGELVHVPDRIAYFHAIDLLRQGAQTADVELRMARKVANRDAQFLCLKVMMTALRDENGAFTGFVAQSLDNHEIVEGRSKALALREEADHANEAKSRFLAAVSHELRTPLNAILGFSDILAGEYFGKLENDRQREYVDLINQSGNHLLSVVNTMLDMSKIEAGHYRIQAEPFMIEDMAHACEAMLSHQASKKKVTLTFRVAKNSGEVSADRGALKQVLINLVGNAIKFTDTGGVVCVDVAVRGKVLEFVVSDTGIGIPAEQIANLGQPFMQVDNEYTREFEGTGLGLSLVKGLVALHGGQLEITSELGEGTVVTVRLPADGSGAAELPAGAEGEAAVQFPPRLFDGQKQKDEIGVSDHAKAKSA